MSRLLKNARFRTFAETSGASFHGGGASPQWSGQQSDGDTIIEGKAEEKIEDPDNLPRAK
jgi:hypothetical protein